MRSAWKTNWSNCSRSFMPWTTGENFQFCKESEEACSWVNASSTREIDCRICIQEALDKRDDLDKEQKSQILKHSEKDMFWEPDWMHRKH